MATRRQTNNPDTGAQRRNPEHETTGKAGKKDQPQKPDDRRKQQPDVGEQEDVNDELMDDEDELEDQNEDEEEDVI